ncbi:hypothetical protein KJ940_19925, partial [Myxococcota bacterium]|nr:hypothetical protein [Myxococcota bacterium]
LDAALDAGRPDAAIEDAADTAVALDAARATRCEGYRAPAILGTLPEALGEISGLVASRQNPGVLWAHNDSGDAAVLYALNEAGQLLGRLRLPGVEAIDFEDIAAGPCPDGPFCLWVADIGDNDLSREDAALHLVAEPQLGGPIPFAERDASALWTRPIRYLGGAIDAEALAVSPDGATAWIFEKREGDVARAFPFEGPLTAEGITTLSPLPAFAAPGVAIEMGKRITGAALHPSGQALLIRVYTGSYEYRFEGGQGVADLADLTPTLVALGPADEPQGEAICYRGGGRGIFTASEAKDDTPSSLHFYACAEPSP